MFSLITKGTIHEEAKNPSFNIIKRVLQRRWNYLGHILRMDVDRAVWKISTWTVPKRGSSLLDDTSFRTVDEMITAATDHEQWKVMFKG